MEHYIQYCIKPFFKDFVGNCTIWTTSNNIKCNVEKLQKKRFKSSLTTLAITLYITLYNISSNVWLYCTIHTILIKTLYNLLASAPFGIWPLSGCTFRTTFRLTSYNYWTTLYKLYKLYELYNLLYNLNIVTVWFAGAIP